MTSSEKRLVNMFLITAFVGVNFVAYNIWSKKHSAVQSKLQKAESELNEAQQTSEAGNSIADNLEWLNARDLKPKNEQEVQNELKQFAYQEAQRCGLQVGAQKLLAAVAPDKAQFNRSRVEFKVSGTEEVFYRWCDRLQSPDQLRALTYMRLTPAREDNTKIEATVIAEQWFIPSSH